VESGTTSIFVKKGNSKGEVENNVSCPKMSGTVQEDWGLPSGEQNHLEVCGKKLNLPQARQKSEGGFDWEGWSKPLWKDVKVYAGCWGGLYMWGDKR